MHELSIIEALLESAETALRPYAAPRVTTVTVRIGALRQVVPSTLEFCFQAATAGTALAGAKLAIEPVAARAWCRDCRAEFAVTEDWFECPRCHGMATEVLAGNELLLASLEFDSAGAASELLEGSPV